MKRKAEKPIVSRASAKPKAATVTTQTLRGAAQLAVDAVVQTSALAGAVHGGIQRVATLGVLGSSHAPGGIAGWVYNAVGGVTKVVGHSLDALLRCLPENAEAPPRSRRAAALISALNGVLGDHLHASRNPLVIQMHLQRQGFPMALDRPLSAGNLAQGRRKVAVLIHGLCMNSMQWQPLPTIDDKENSTSDPNMIANPSPIELLLDKCDYSVLHLNYNSGRHIGDNAAELNVLLDQLLKAWPAPIDELLLVGHSMGGLLARSACHQAEMSEAAWLKAVDKLICLGSPHHGAPLERAGQGVDQLLSAIPLVAPFARLGKIRSAGITDLRHGSLLMAEGDRFASKSLPALLPTPSSIKLYVMAASRSKPAEPASKRLRSDGLVPVTSALGEHRSEERSLRVPASRQAVLLGLHHLELMHHPSAMEQLSRWLSGD